MVTYDPYVLVSTELVDPVYDYVDIPSGDIGDGENTLSLLPEVANLPPYFPITQSMSQKGWVLNAELLGDTWAIQRVNFYNASPTPRTASMRVSAESRGEFMTPYLTGGSGEVWFQWVCTDQDFKIVGEVEFWLDTDEPSEDGVFSGIHTMTIPPYSRVYLKCSQSIYTLLVWQTNESYDAAVTALDVPETLEVPPPRRQGFSVEVMNQGVEDIAGAVHLVASAGRPDRYLLPFDVLEPGERITLTSSSLWRPSMRPATVEWTATVELDDEYPDDEYADNDVMTAETEMIRVRP